MKPLAYLEAMYLSFLADSHRIKLSNKNTELIESVRRDTFLRAFRSVKNQIPCEDLYEVHDQVLYYRGIEVPIQYDDYGMSEYIVFNGHSWSSYDYLDMTDWLDDEILQKDLDLSGDDYSKRYQWLLNFLADLEQN